MDLYSITTASTEETQFFAARVGALLRAYDVVLLNGELGAGKTTFTQGLARGMGARGSVTSPTFTLAQEYSSSSLTLFHFDPYRLKGPHEVMELGFDEYLERGGVVVVEWAERLGGLTPPEHLRVDLETLSETARRIVLTPSGSRYVQLNDALRAQADPV